MKLKIGINSAISHDFKILTDFTLKNGFKVIELHPEFVDITEKEISFLKKLNLNYTVHAPFRDINIGADDRNARKQAIDLTINCIEIAKKLNSNIIILHPCMSIEELTPKKEKWVWNNLKRVLKKILPIAKKYNIKITIENMDFRKKLFTKPIHFKRLFKLFPNDNLGITLDVNHVYSNKIEISEFLLLKDKIFHVHISDLPGTKLLHHIPIGEGVIDFKKILRFLKGIAYSGFIVLECGKDANKTVKSKDYLLNIAKRV